MASARSGGTLNPSWAKCSAGPNNFDRGNRLNLSTAIDTPAMNPGTNMEAPLLTWDWSSGICAESM